MARPKSAASILRNIKKGERVVETHAADVASGMVLPNNSGEHKKGIKRDTPINDFDLTNKSYVDTLTTDHPHQDVNTTATPTFDGLTSSGQIALNKVGANIITATNANGDLRLGAGGGTNDLQIDINGNVEIFENLTLGTNKILSVDHIGEKTAAHGVVVDNDLIVASSTFTETGPGSWATWTTTKDRTIFEVEGGDIKYQFFGTVFGVSPSGVNLGSPALRWKDIYSSGTTFTNTVDLGTNTITDGNLTGSWTSIVNLTATGKGTFNELSTTEFIVETDGDTFWVGDGTGLPFAEIYARDNTATTSTSTTKAQILIFDTDGEFNNMTPSHAQDHISIVSLAAKSTMPDIVKFPTSEPVPKVLPA